MSYYYLTTKHQRNSFLCGLFKVEKREIIVYLKDFPMPVYIYFCFGLAADMTSRLLFLLVLRI